MFQLFTDIESDKVCTCFSQFLVSMVYLVEHVTSVFPSAGETAYNLETAAGLRMEVQKYYEHIDALRYGLVFVYRNKFGFRLGQCHFFSVCHLSIYRMCVRVF